MSRAAGGSGDRARAARLGLADLRRAFWHLRHGGVPQVRRWWARRNVPRPRTFDAVVLPDGRVTFDPWPIPDRAPTRPGLRVAVVLDDFSRLAFAFEWQQVEVTPDDWRAVLEAEPVDLLFVESAWAGNGGAWRYQVTSPQGPKPAFVEMVAWCREHGVPTVFWNKEDPAHYDDFLPAARLFDHVFTTDVNRVPAYRADLGHDRVGVLPFAAQPAIHSPVRPSGGRENLRDVAFAGMWFAHRHPGRRAQMEMLLGAAARAGERMPIGLEIFSRQLGGEERYQFPAPFDAHVVGSLDYPRMLSAYRAYKVFLNVNTVTDSPTMCARRVFEITASGTPVVSTPSAGLAAVFPPDEVAQVAEPDEAERVIGELVADADARDRMVHRAQRRIWAGHAYSHRVDTVLDAVGVAAPRTATPTVTAIVSTNRPGQLEHVLGSVARQRGVPVQLALLTHGFEAPRDLRARAADLGIPDVVLLTADEAVSLGKCLNRLVAAADGDLVAKVDDDDLYGPDYLRDQVAALGFSGADVVGKHAHYLRLEGRGVTVLRYPEREHVFTHWVAGPTIVARRALAVAHPFPHVSTGEDTGFLRAVVQAGGSVYAADRFSFCQVRRSHGHTWQVSDDELLASGVVLPDGDAIAEVVIQ